MIEAIIKPISTGNNLVILSFLQNYGNITFGIDANGQINFSSGNDFYESQEAYSLYNEECHHIGVSVSEEYISFYVDGYLVESSLLVQPLQVFTNTTQFTLGKNPQNNTSFYKGVIDEVRMWSSQRSLGSIQSLAFTSPPINDPSRYFIFSFWEGSGNKSVDNYNSLANNVADWSMSNLSWVETCMEPQPSFKLGFRTQEPDCIKGGCDSNLICNGGFEQYDPVLVNNYYSSTPGVLANGQVFQTTFGISDIVNWRSTTNSMSPDIYIRNGIGQVPVDITGLYTTLVNTHDWPATGNNAMAGLVSYNTWYEGITTPRLVDSVKVGKSYTFSGWFYSYCKCYNPNGTAHKLQISLKNSVSGISYSNIPLIIPTDKNYVTTNNGWEYLSVSFTIPSNTPGTNFNQFTIKAVPIGSGNKQYYTLMDDLCLVEGIPPGVWPQSAPLSSHHNQSSGGGYQRYQGVDDGGNVYVAGNDYHHPDTCSYFLRKYDNGGSVIWSLPVTFSDQRVVTAFDVDDNGNCYLGIYKPNNGQAIIRKYDENGVLVASSSSVVYDKINDLVLNQNQTDLFVAYSDKIRISDILTVPVISGVQKTQFSEIHCLAVDGLGNVIVAGLSAVGIPKPLRIQRLNSNLSNTAFINLFVPGGGATGSAGMFLQDLEVDAANNVYLAGAYSDSLQIGNVKVTSMGSFWPYPTKGYLAKFKSSLSTLWINNFDAQDSLANQNTVNSIAISDSNQIMISGTYFNKIKMGDTVYTNNSSPNVASHETYIASFKTNGDLRWFRQTQTQTGATHYDKADHCSVISSRPGFGDFVVTGNFLDTNRIEIFDHGTLLPGSDNNVFTCQVIDHGNYAFFKQNTENTTVTSYGFKLYPNPNSGLLNADFLTEPKSGALLTIYNLQGNMVFSKLLFAQDNEINISALPAGLYLVNMVLGNHVTTEKLYLH